MVFYEELLVMPDAMVHSCMQIIKTLSILYLHIIKTQGEYNNQNDGFFTNVQMQRNMSHIHAQIVRSYPKISFHHNVNTLIIVIIIALVCNQTIGTNL